MDRKVLIFAAATLTPALLLGLAATLGGLWGLLALLYLTGFALAMDALVRFVVGPADTAEFPDADILSITLALLHFVLLALALWALSGGAGLGWIESIPVLLGFGLFFGQISNSNAHELIHRADRRLFALGMWVYISLLFGHHTSAHRQVHHRFVATDADPSTAQLDESFYDFAPRAWWDGFRAGYEMEQARSSRLAAGKRRVNPYVVYVGGAAGCLLAVLLLFGLGGLLVYLLLAAHAQTQLLLSDYVQHYGLTRRRLPDGRTEPVGVQHSWNAPHWFSALMLLNAPRHSAHHAQPGLPYAALTLPGGLAAPSLPYSLPVMAVLALLPRHWRRVMNPRALAWRNAPMAATSAVTWAVQP